jgi:hypothetical protein
VVVHVHVIGGCLVRGFEFRTTQRRRMRQCWDARSKTTKCPNSKAEGAVLGRHAFIHPPFEEGQALGGPPLVAGHVS